MFSRHDTHLPKMAAQKEDNKSLKQAQQDGERWFV